MNAYNNINGTLIFI